MYPTCYALVYLVNYLTYNKDEFSSYFNYIRELQFDEKPDYQYLRDLFRKMLMKNEYVYDLNFDWNLNVDKLLNILGKF